MNIAASLLRGDWDFAEKLPFTAANFILSLGGELMTVSVKRSDKISHERFRISLGDPDAEFAVPARRPGLYYSSRQNRSTGAQLDQALRSTVDVLFVAGRSGQSARARSD